MKLTQAVGILQLQEIKEAFCHLDQVRSPAAVSRDVGEGGGGGISHLSMVISCGTVGRRVGSEAWLVGAHCGWAAAALSGLLSFHFA